MLMGASVSTASFTALFFAELPLGTALSARSGSGVVGRGVMVEVVVVEEEGTRVSGVVLSPIRSFTSLLMSSRSRVRGSAFVGDAPAGLKGRERGMTT